MSRAQRHRESAQAARRLSAVATRWAAPAVAGGGWTPSAPVADDDFDWFGTGGAPAPPRPPAGGATAAPTAPGASRTADPPPWERWRESVADRVPLPLRGGARVPVAAAVAVLLVALAVVGGAVLRSASAGAQVVPVGRPLQVSSAGASAPEPPRASATPGSGQTSAVPTASPGPSGPSAAAGAVVVDVVGKVRRPGLVRLPPGSRVADAVAAAGGATDDAALTRINLARPLGDGEQVLVPDRDDVLPPVAAPAPPSGGAAASPGVPAGPLDLNAATAADLDGLPGVGPVIAGRIVAWRTEHGRFASVDELAEVAGIGPTLLERLRPLVRV